MARVRRARPSAVRRRRVASFEQRSAGGYRRGRATVAIAIFLLVFGLLWLVNGEFTAEFVMLITGRPASWGWSAHLLITAIEIAPAFLAPYITALPRRVVFVLWLLSLPFGVFDVLSSAVGVAPYLAWTGAAGASAALQNTIIAEIIGFLPEQMMLWLIVALRNVVRG